MSLPLALVLVAWGLALSQYRARLPRFSAVVGGVLVGLALAALWPLGGGLAVVLWFCLLAVAGFTLALQHGLRAPTKKARRRRREARALSTVATVPMAPLLARVLFTLLFSLAALATVALWWPGPPDDRALMAVLIWPLVWSVALLYLHASQRPRRAWWLITAGLAVGLSASLAGWAL